MWYRSEEWKRCVFIIQLVVITFHKATIYLFIYFEGIFDRATGLDVEPQTQPIVSRCWCDSPRKNSCTLRGEKVPIRGVVGAKKTLSRPY